MPAEWKYNLTINEYDSGVRLVRQFARKLARHLNFSSEDEFGLELVLDEAVSNAWEASFATIEVFFVLGTGFLTISILDRGKGMTSGAKCSFNELEINGRGCYLMQAYMDEVLWEPREGGGMCCILKKRVTLQESSSKAVTVPEL